MNAFVASIILSHMPLEEFLDIAPEQRLQYFAGLVGAERIVSTGGFSYYSAINGSLHH